MKQIKGLFLVKEELYENSGITKKIIFQKKAFIRNGCDMKLVYHENNKRRSDEQILCIFKKGKLGRLEKTYKYSDIYNYILEEKINYLYIRYTHFSSFKFLKFLKDLKNSTKITIHLEIPTYPYDAEKEITLNYKNLFILEERFTRKMLKNYIDSIITFGKEKKIFNVKTIGIDNAVEIESINFSDKRLLKLNKKRIDFIGVAGLTFWHGYDRMIKSLGRYYEKNNEIDVYFHIVGDGKTKDDLKVLSKDLKIQDKVIFYGNKSGKELDKIFEKCEIGVDSLGRHRSGNNYNNSLKSKEYLARGIPLIKSHVDLSLKNTDFYYDVSSDENIFGLEKILEWYFKSNFNSEQIRNYVKENLTWDIQIRKILNKI